MWLLFKVQYSDQAKKEISKREFINSFSTDKEIAILLKLLNRDHKDPLTEYTYYYVEPFR